jgi:outer membrane protein
MVQLAFTSRPDLGSLNERYNGARQFSAAEHALNCPTVSALAVVGGTPIRAGQIASSWYGAAGAIVSIPLFNGSRYSTRVCESAFKAKAAREEVRNLRESIARDVRASGFAAQTAFEWIGVTKQLLEQSSLALDLAQTRYKLGLSDIVELRHAQLAQTQGQIAYANALYASLEALAVLKFQTRQ